MSDETRKLMSMDNQAITTHSDGEEIKQGDKDEQTPNEKGVRANSLPGYESAIASEVKTGAGFAEGRWEDDDQFGERSKSSSGSSTPSITEYDIENLDLHEVVVDGAFQENLRSQEEEGMLNKDEEGPAELGDTAFRNEAADKLGQPASKSDPGENKHEIVVEMETFTRSSTRRKSFMLAMECEKNSDTEDNEIMSAAIHGDSRAIVGAINQEETDWEEETTIDDVQTEKSTGVPGSSQGFTILGIFTDDDMDTVKAKWRRRLHFSNPRSKVLCAVFVVGVVTAVLTAVFVPVSLVYVEYHQIALARSRLTGQVDRSKTLYPGCYLMLPDTELIRFTATAHLLRVDAHISSSEGLAFRLQLALQYFIKPQELGELHRDFGEEYGGVINRVIKSEVKNQAVFLSLDQYRHERDTVHSHLHAHLAARLQGDCCLTCCPGHCDVSHRYSRHNCSTCNKSAECDRGFHVTLLPQHFQVLTLQLPENLTERYLRYSLLYVDADKEIYVQEHMLEKKKTEKLVKIIEKTAHEVLEAARADARSIGLVAEAEAEKIRQKAYAEAMGRLFASLNITSLKNRLSLMNTLALRDFGDQFSLQQYEYLSVL